MSQPGEDQDLTRPTPSLDRLVRQAAIVLLVEQMWPVAVGMVALAALFVALAWGGLWLALPPLGRMVGLGLLGLAGLACLWPLHRLRWPSRAACLARLDRDAGVAHQPATLVEDALALSPEDPATRALWALHQRRMAKAAANLRVRLPASGLAARDPFALRAGVVVLLVASAFVAGPDKELRLMAAFDVGSAGAEGPSFRTDIWLDPPAYTGRPPVTIATGLSTANVAPESEPLSVPMGSTLVVRSTGQGGPALDVSGALQPVPVEGDPKSTELRWMLQGDATLRVSRYGRTLGRFALHASPDTPPTITLIVPPRANLRGSLTLRYTIDDQYGVTGAEAFVTSPSLQGQSVGAHPLVPPPRPALPLPSGRGGLGTTEATLDLADSPWAGTHILLGLSATNGAGQVGYAAPAELDLPQRIFTQPIARALVEQRRLLVLEPALRQRVATAFEALLLAPDQFGTPPAIYLGLRTIAQDLNRARTDDGLRAVADFMWEMALQIEDGTTSQAEQDVRAAQKALREALQNGAPPEEIARLTAQLRTALDAFLKEMAGRQGKPAAGGGRKAAKTITPHDLQTMLDQMQAMAQAGNRADAEQMLDALQSVLENLQTADQGGGPPDPAQQALAETLNELDKVTRDQGALRDETYRQGQQGARPQSKPDADEAEAAETGDEPEPANPALDAPTPAQRKALQDKQQALGARLGAVQKKLKELGAKSTKGFDDAGQAMGEAADSLGSGPAGDAEGAVAAQGRALQALRQGADQLAREMQENGQGQAGRAGSGQEGPEGPEDQDQPGAGDPLGRGGHGRRAAQGRYDPQGVPAAQRAQQILEELRHRLGDPARPQVELDYLERLLRPY